jgi:parallel beta-helix repeat protein
MRRLIFTVLLLLALPSLGEAVIWHVKATGGSTGNCTTAVGAADPGIYLRTINAGLACVTTAAGAGANDTVKVYAGTYAETLQNNMPGGTSWSSPFTLTCEASRTCIIRPGAHTVDLIRIGNANAKFFIVNGFEIDGSNNTSSANIIGHANLSGLQGRWTDNWIHGGALSGPCIATADLNGPNFFVGNRIGDCQGEPTGGSGSHGMYIKTIVAGTIIENNEIYNNFGMGIQCYPDCLSTIIRNNYIHSNGARGILVQGQSGTVVYNNVLYRNGLNGTSTAISIDGNTNARVYGNTIVSHQGSGAPILILASGVTVRNNLCLGNKSSSCPSGGSTVSNNLNTGSLTDFFVNPTGDFHLKDTATAAINTGFSLGTPYNVDKDGAGRPQGVAYDIGAYEFGGTTVAPTLTIFSASPQSIGPGQISTITWATQNATACTASGAWAGVRTTSGTEGVGTGGKYTITCTGPGGSVQQSLEIIASSPILKLPSKPSSLRLGALSEPIKIGPGGGGDTPDAPIVATDNFTRADGPLGTNWDDTYSVFRQGEIVNGRVRLSFVGGNLVATWTGGNISPNQSAEVTIRTLTPGTGTREGGVILRGSASPTFTGYYVVGSTNASQTTRIFKMTANSSALLASNTTQAWQAGDILKASVIGATVSVYRNGGAVPVLSFTDPTPVASGQPGIGGFVTTSGTVEDMELDNFNIVEFAPPPVAGAPCHRYAAPFPTGNGSGLSQANAYTIASFWPEVSSTVRNLCLLDGTYTGTASVIQPPSGLSGTSASPIRVMAVNDGGPWINGQAARVPIVLNNNDWWIVEGIDASDSSGVVAVFSNGASNSIIRRVCAWNSPVTANDRVFGVSGGATLNNTFEDVCGFGTGRKIFSLTQGGPGTTIRRAWGSFTKHGPTAFGPHDVYILGYNTDCPVEGGPCAAVDNHRLENVIGTWKLAASTDFSSTCCKHGITFGDEGVGHEVLGSMIYFRTGDNVPAVNNMLLRANNRGVLIKDIVLYSELTITPLQLNNAACTSCVLTNSTEIGGGNSSIGAVFSVTNREDYASIAAMNADNGNPFQTTTGNGARMCYRYLNGTLTTTPLWPWPMNDRINAALSRSGRNPADYFGAGRTLTTYLESVFGTIPAGCRS